MQKIIVLDFGSQYAQLIVRRIRELGVYSELVSWKITAQQIKDDKEIVGIILSGGPNTAYEANAPKVDPAILDLEIPILGICYGMQTVCQQLGGKVITGQHKEFGKITLTVKNDSCPILTDWKENEIVWMSHNDQVEIIPHDFKLIASTKITKYAVVQNKEKNIYLVQFHPEVLQTEKGTILLHNFAFAVCHAEGNWKMESVLEQEIKQIKETVQDEQVICALSGGVDSSVVAALMHKAIGKQLTCVFVDTGLLRKDEGDMVEKVFKETFHIKLLRIDASEIFLSKLKGLTDPEKKRKCIGKTFIDVFKECAKNIPHLKWLAQGTIYPDVIESGTDTAHVIKSHHNVGGLPKNMKLKLIEPLKFLFKDEVRILGKKLGLPDKLICRQPFPGPGLGIRILGRVTREKIRLVQEADLIVRQEIEKANLQDSLWQYFAILPDVKTVGCKGDLRSYEDLIMIRIVSSVDAMTASFAHIPYEVLSTISSRITNEVHGINRVGYDITSKPPGTIEWE